ncbi:MAG: isochorismate synthase [Verrucomicrobia bacterium]|nr:isochorismate synthase [Leptolyngbya sp. ES-bin-22]
MTVTPHRNSLFQSRKELHHVLSRHQQIAREKKQAQIVSLSQVIDAVDPLVILQRFATSGQPAFYFEKRERDQNDVNEGVVVAAIGAVAYQTVDGANRFTTAKDFIQSTLAEIATYGSFDLPLAGPHFFCSFAFFDDASPQDARVPAATIVLPKWHVSYCNQRSVVVANLCIHAATKLEQCIDEVWQTWQSIRSIRHTLLLPAIDHRLLRQTRDVAGTQHFKQAVQSALSLIQQNILSKIVLAHAVDVVSPLPFDAIASLHNLRQLYPGCYLFLSSNGNGQQFIGASPERLVSLHNGQLETDALAGSAPRGKTVNDDVKLANRLLHSVKELHEHRVVDQFIQQQLAQLGLKPQRLPLRLLQLSNIQHLQTPIHATVAAHTHLLDVVAALHPTPAVAGMPRTIACDYIRRYEPFERSLYAAPIGWVDHHGNGEFAVGIRSALLNGCHARLFAGAGIVEGSDPDRELAEVQLKLQALLQALV